MTWLLSRTACSGDRSISCTVRSSSWYAFRAKCILGMAVGGSQVFRGVPRYLGGPQVLQGFQMSNSVPGNTESPRCPGVPEFPGVPGTKEVTGAWGGLKHCRGVPSVQGVPGTRGSQVPGCPRHQGVSQVPWRIPGAHLRAQVVASFLSIRAIS